MTDRKMLGAAQVARDLHLKLFDSSSAAIIRLLKHVDALDRNGDVALGMSKVCGKAEVDLSEPCTQHPSIQPSIELVRAARDVRAAQRAHADASSRGSNVHEAARLRAAFDALRRALAEHEAKGETK
jgi:hypothetical protein